MIVAIAIVAAAAVVAIALSGTGGRSPGCCSDTASPPSW